MPRFTYNARNSRGDLVKGDLDAKDYTAAIRRVAASNLFIIDLHEIRHEVRYEEPSLEKDKKDIKRPDDSGDAIIFMEKGNKEIEKSSTAGRRGNKAAKATKAKYEPDDELKELCDRVNALLEEKQEHMTRVTREELSLQLEKVDWVRESRNDKLLKKQLKTIEKLLKQAQKEITKYEVRMWEQWGKGLQSRKAPSVFQLSTLFGVGGNEGDESEPTGDTKVHEKEIYVEGHPTSPIQQVIYWCRVLNNPDADKEEEVLMREKYDAVWTELQRFTGVLLFFYMVFYFVAYSYLQTQVGDSFILRVYDTPLFKQIVLVLFAAFGLLTLRKNYIARKMWFDGVLFVAWTGVLWTLMR